MPGDDRGPPARPREPRLRARVRRRLGRRDRPADQQRRRHGAAADAAPPDGFELQFGTNHLGHFALTNLLLEHVTGRVVTVSSTAPPRRPHRLRRPQLGAPAATRPGAPTGSPSSPTCCSPRELQRRLAAAGSPVLATAAHPGYAATNLQFHSGSRASRTSSRGSATGCSLRTSTAARCRRCTPPLADIPGDSFAGPGGFMQQRGAGRSSSAARRAAQDADVARRLWDRLRGADRGPVPARRRAGTAGSGRSPGLAHIPRLGRATGSGPRCA